MLAAVIAATALCAFGATERASAKGFLRGLGDPIFKAGDAATRDRWMEAGATAGAGIVRIDLSWRSVTQGGGPPSDPTNPADPGYDFSHIDEAVRSAASNGLQVLLTVQEAPTWAEANNRPADAPPGVWKPDPKALGEFGEALSRRYSGSFMPLGSLAPLPRVSYYEAWNEPNISIFIWPQWHRREPVSPDVYRRMLNAFYDGVHRGSTGAKVIAGSTAPFGDNGGPGALRVRPLEFMRDLLCLKGNLKPSRCKTKAKFDIYSHHPINVTGSPRKSAADPDDVSAIVDMANVRRTLRAAERAGTVKTRGRHPVWATELWWETNPPDKTYGYRLGTQAGYIQDSLYLLWREGVKAGILLQVVDTPVGPKGYEGLQSGLYFSNGDPKPSLTAFRFPFVTERRRRSRKVSVWSIPPLSGQLQIEKKSGGGWRTIKRAQVRAGHPFKATMRFGGSARLRAEVGGEQSLTWQQPGVGGRHSTRRSRAGASPAASASAGGAPIDGSRLGYLLDRPPTP